MAIIISTHTLPEPTKDFSSIRYSSSCNFFINQFTQQINTKQAEQSKSLPWTMCKHFIYYRYNVLNSAKVHNLCNHVNDVHPPAKRYFQTWEAGTRCIIDELISDVTTDQCSALAPARHHAVHLWNVNEQLVASAYRFVLHRWAWHTPVQLVLINGACFDQCLDWQFILEQQEAVTCHTKPHTISAYPTCIRRTR